MYVIARAVYFIHGPPVFSILHVLSDPSERHDLYGQKAYAQVVASLKAMYDVERAVAVYPCRRGPSS